MPADFKQYLIDREEASINMVLDGGNMRSNQESEYGESDTEKENENNMREMNPYSRQSSSGTT